MSNRRIHPWIAAALLWMLALGARAQGPTFQYFYDDSGQLTKVVDATGIVIVYVYDPAGNMVEIKRTVGSSGTLSILSFAPGQGGPLIPVTIRGQGFSATPSENTVQFNGISATVLSASTATLVATVPINAV